MLQDFFSLSAKLRTKPKKNQKNQQVSQTVEHCPLRQEFRQELFKKKIFIYLYLNNAKYPFYGFLRLYLVLFISSVSSEKYPLHGCQWVKSQKLRLLDPAALSGSDLLWPLCFLVHVM